MSDWIELMRHEVDKTSLNTVGNRIGYSYATISLVLSGKYPSNLNRIKERFENEFLLRHVQCPVLGSINRNECLDHQAAPFSSANFQRVQLYRACHSGKCPHAKKEVINE